MTDELLLKRLRIGWHDDDTPIWVSDAMDEAADRIEALTEKNQSLALDHLAALGQAAEQIEALTAERDRLREALNETAQILSQCTFETIIVRGQYIDRREAVSRARAALNTGKEPSHE